MKIDNLKQLYFDPEICVNCQHFSNIIYFDETRWSNTTECEITGEYKSKYMYCDKFKYHERYIK